jgi:hypothetical protein
MQQSIKTSTGCLQYTTAWLRGASRGLAVSPGRKQEEEIRKHGKEGIFASSLPSQSMLGRFLADEGVLVWGRMRRGGGGEVQSARVPLDERSGDHPRRRDGRELLALLDLTAEYRADGRPRVESAEANVPDPIRSTRPDRVEGAPRLPVGNSPTRRGQRGRKKDRRPPCRNDTLPALHLQNP